MELTDYFQQLHLAAKKNDYLAILQLLAQGVEVDRPNKADGNKTALHTAIAESKLLVKHKIANPS